MTRYLIGFVLPALALLLLGFWMGSLENPIFGMLGFVSCFTAAAALLIEGKKKCLK